MYFFQQYGARRTGTNYIQLLLEENFTNIAVLDHTLAWKHGFPNSPYEYKKNVMPLWPDETAIRHSTFKRCCAGREDLFAALKKAVTEEQIRHLVHIKNPYAWIESMWRWSITSSEKPENNQHYIYFDFDKNPNLAECEQLVKDSIESYNVRYQVWFSDLPYKRETYLVRYEDVVSDSVKFLDKFYTQFNHLIKREPNSNQWVDFNNGVDPSPLKTGQHNKDHSYRDYYLQQHYLRNLPPNIINVITENVNWEFFQKLGYLPIQQT